jgi:hypothetical protein
MIESVLHIIGVCPDTNNHFDLINLYFCYIENNLNFKVFLKYLKQKIYV